MLPTAAVQKLLACEIVLRKPEIVFNAAAETIPAAIVRSDILASVAPGGLCYDSSSETVMDK